MPKLLRITALQLLRAPKRMGFLETRQTGSHLTVYHSARDVVVTVPVHSRKTLAPKPLLSTLKQGKLAPDELRENL